MIYGGVLNVKGKGELAVSYQLSDVPIALWGCPNLFGTVSLTSVPNKLGRPCKLFEKRIAYIEKRFVFYGDVFYNILI